MKNALLLLVMILPFGAALAAQDEGSAPPAMVEAPVGTAIKYCSLCTLPSGLYCWADYGDPTCTAPSSGPSGATVVGHCTPSQASQYCAGHPSNPAPGDSPWCTLCQLPSGNFCAANYGSPCTNPLGAGIVWPCNVSQANTYCAGHYYTPAPTTSPTSPTSPPPGSGSGGSTLTETGSEDSRPDGPAIP